MLITPGSLKSFYESQYDRLSSRMPTIASIHSKHVGCVLCLLSRTDCYVWIRRKNLWLFVFVECNWSRLKVVLQVRAVCKAITGNNVVVLAFLLRKARLVSDMNQVAIEYLRMFELHTCQANDRRSERAWMGSKSHFAIWQLHITKRQRKE